MKRRLDRFSWLTSDSSCATRPEWDTILFENDEFAIVPSLGSLVPGWLLAVPKKKAPNLSCLAKSERIELIQFIAGVMPKMEGFDGQPFLFEHGGATKSQLSCGVDQAHLHIVSLPFNLTSEASSKAEVKWEKEPFSDDPWAPLPSNSEYLMVSDLQSTYLGFLRQPTSQWFRKIIAKKMGVEHEWNYKNFPQLNNIKTTISKLAA